MISQPSSQISHAQPLTVEAIRSDLKTRQFGHVIHLYNQIDSTNATALALAEQGASEGTVVLAEFQTKGRGRMGRHWISPRDLNVYLSIILRPASDPRRMGLWSLAAAVAVAHAIEQMTSLPARLKWPNDVLVRHKKVSGLLLESTLHEGRLKYLVLGIGVNVNILRGAFPETLRESATSLREELGRDVDRIALIRRLLENLEAAYRSFQAEPPQKVLEAYTALSETLGQTVTVQAPGREWTGRAVGLTPDGALILQKDDQQEAIICSDDVIHVRRSHVARD